MIIDLAPASFHVGLSTARKKEIASGPDRRAQIDITVYSYQLSFSVSFVGKPVMVGCVEFGGRGNYFNGRIGIKTWKRKGTKKSWQTMLFDAFPNDSARILEVAPDELATAVSELLRLPATLTQELFASGVLDRPGEFAHNGFLDICEICEQAAADGIPFDQIAVSMLQLGAAMLSTSYQTGTISSAIAQWGKELPTLRRDLSWGSTLASPPLGR